MSFARRSLDPYLLAILAMVGLAVLGPAQGSAAVLLGGAGKALVALLFLLYGARLSPQAVWQGLAQWRLQVLVLGGTFALFPLVGMAARPLLSGLISPELCLGFLLLCALPSTVQSSIAFTGMAGGNVAAALCAASASSLIGIAATPLIAGWLLGAPGGPVLGSLDGILLQLLLPFLAGQAARPWIAASLQRAGRWVGWVDRGAVLLIVYTAVSAAALAGVWRQLQPLELGGVALIDAALLALVLAAMAAASRGLGLARGDEIVAVFCGGNKSLVAGMPMLAVLLAAATAGAAVVPLILFHQIQLLAGAALARRYARVPTSRLARSSDSA